MCFILDIKFGTNNNSVVQKCKMYSPQLKIINLNPGIISTNKIII